MLSVEIALPDIEELHKLVEQGRRRGSSPTTRSSPALEDVELTKEQIEDFYTYLIDHCDRARRGRAAQAPAARAAGARRGREGGPKLDLTVEPSLDSLRLYLREIGKVPLLTADQEVSLAKRIERGDMVGEDSR